MAQSVEVARFQDIVEADLALAFLRAHGIDADLQGRAHVAVDPILQQVLGLRITAPASQHDLARALLARANRGEFAAEGDDMESRDTTTQTSGSLLAVVSLAVGGYAGTSLPRRLKPVHWVGIAMLATIALGSFTILWGR